MNHFPEQPGAYFLHQTNTQLHVAPEVKSAVQLARAEGQRIPNQPADRISAYLAALDQHFPLGGQSTGQLSTAYRLWPKRDVTDAALSLSNIPHHFYTHESARMQQFGFGYVEANDAYKQRIEDELRDAQSWSFGTWVDNLEDPNKAYPIWFRFFALNGIRGLSSRIANGNHFEARDNHTTDKYPEYHPEAVAEVYAQTQPFASGEPIQGDPASLKFGQLYAAAFLRLTRLERTASPAGQGVWRQFKQSAEYADAFTMAQAQYGHGTGWCTAYPDFSARYLRDGDFYTYLTPDRNGRYAIPRAIVRLLGGTVLEVSGTKPEQSLEDAIWPIVNQQLEQLPGGPQYWRRKHDTYNLSTTTQDMSIYDWQIDAAGLRTLYLTDLQSFAPYKDPRISAARNLYEIKNKNSLAQVMDLLKRQLRDQTRQAYMPYLEIMNAANARSGSIMTEEEFRQESENQINMWEKEGILHAVISDIRATDTHYQSIAVPNLSLSSAQVLRLGQVYPGQEEALSEMYHTYLHGELSGRSAGKGPLRFKLVATCNRPAEKTESLSLAPSDLSVLDSIVFFKSLAQKTRRHDPTLSVPTPENSYIVHAGHRPIRNGASQLIPVVHYAKNGRPVFGAAQASATGARRPALG